MDDKFEKLNNANYKPWAIRMRGVLVLQDCLGAIEFNTSTLTNEQIKEDEKCKALLYLSVDNDNLNGIKECTTAREIWNKLIEIHTKFDSYHSVRLLKEFVSLEKSQNEDILEYMNRRGDLYKKLQGAGFNFENKVLMGLMLIGLPKEYEYLMKSFKIDDETLSLADLEIRLAEEERRLKDNDTKNNAILYTAKNDTTSKQHSFQQETNSNETAYLQIKMEEMEFKLEDLHHSIDIKEETSMLNCEPDRELKTEVNKKPFTCDLCGYKCAHRGNLNTHLRTHSGEKPFMCDICNYECARKDSLTKHLRTHTGDRPFLCDICNYKCAHKGKLKIHLRTHTGEKPFTCEICGYKCAQKEYLKIHLKTHTGEKPFSCDICNYKCTLTGKLKIHLRTHTGEKPFTCEICSYRCAQKVNLKKHLKTHTGEKPFTCVICNYKSARKENLKKHLKIHTGEKPFTCEICDFKCVQKGNLKIHLKTHNGKKISLPNVKI